MALVQAMMNVEVTPLLNVPSGIGLGACKNVLAGRFSKPAIGNRLPRIGTGWAARIPMFVLLSITDAVERGLPAKLLGFTAAAWSRYLFVATRR